MKIKIENDRYNVEVEIKDSELRNKYAGKEDYVEKVIKGYFDISIGLLDEGNLARMLLELNELKLIKERRMICREAQTVEDLVKAGEDKLNEN